METISAAAGKQRGDGCRRLPHFLFDRKQTEELPRACERGSGAGSMLTPSAPILEGPRSPRSPQVPCWEQGWGGQTRDIHRDAPGEGSSSSKTHFRGAEVLLHGPRARPVCFFLGRCAHGGWVRGMGTGSAPTGGGHDVDPGGVAGLRRGCRWGGASPGWRWWLRGAWAGTPPTPALTPGTELAQLSTGCEHEAGRIWPVDVPRGTKGRVESPSPAPFHPAAAREGAEQAGGEGKTTTTKKIKGATPSPSPEALLWTLQIRFSEKEMFYRP